MCTKHDACCSGNTKTAPNIRSCSSAAPAVVSSVKQGENGCSGSSCCSSDTPPEEEGPASRYKTTLSWYVSGMDCPACAQKVEKAVSSIDGVKQVQVRFATEKLIVSGPGLIDQQEVTDAVEGLGFSLHASENAAPVKSSGKVDWLKRNATILLLSIAMMVSAAIGRVSPQLATYLFAIVCMVGVIPIVVKAWKLTKSGTPFSMETLMSVAALGALYLGETAEAAMVLLLFLLGERLEAYAAGRARSGVKALMELVPEQATLIENGIRKVVAVSDLKPGDIIEVAPGDRLPADGMIKEGQTSIDESALTGESVPVEKTQGESVMAGSVVVDRTVVLTITSSQGENAIDRILHLIEEADARKAPLERFLDRFSRWYTPLMMLVALAVIVTPPLLFAQPWETWLYRGLALLLIACPCALVISTPAAITSGLATAARHGALIKGGAALEQLGKIETIAFDKTGTLTQGKPQVTDVLPLNGWNTEQLLAYSGAVEEGSRHPLAVALVRYLEQRGVMAKQAKDKQALIGVGITGQVEGVTITLNAPAKAKQPLSVDTIQLAEALEQDGKTVVVVLADQQEAGVIAWRDTLREDAGQAVKALDQLGINAIMLTGDNAVSAQAMANHIGMDYRAGLLPQDKVAFVEQLSAVKQVAMVGDGINDAPAMKSASVGIAMGGGTDVALETADAALTHNRLKELPFMIQLSRSTLAIIKQNITLALGLKGVFLVTSLLGLTGLWVAVLADSGATALVTLNALRLLREKPRF